MKQYPEWRITIYPKTAIPQRKIEAVAIADMVADMAARRPTSWGGILSRGGVGNDWNDWQRMGDDLEFHNVGFAQFNDDGSIDETPQRQTNQKAASGFYPVPSLNPLPVAGDKSTFGALAVDDAFDTTSKTITDVIAWKVKSGNFEASRALTSTSTTALLNVNDPEGVSKAETEHKWPKGCGVAFDVTLLGTRSETTQAHCYIQVSADLRVALRQNQFPVLERRNIVRGRYYAKTIWTIWRTMDKAPKVNTHNSHYFVMLIILAGRLVWVVNDHKQWVVDTVVDASKTATQGNTTTTANMSLLIGVDLLLAETSNLRARIETSKVLSNTPGTITHNRTPIAAQGTSLTPYATGNQPYGTSLQTALSSNGYTVTLNAAADGINTPFATTICHAYVPVWVTPTGSGTDIAKVVKRAVASHAHPPVQAGTDGSITIDLALLNKLMPSSASLLQDYAPVQLEGRWDGGTWEDITAGYLLGTSGEQQSYNDATLTFTIAGPMMRLKKPAALVDSGNVPLDYIFYQRIAPILAVQAMDLREGNYYNPGYDGSGNIISMGPIKLDSLNYYGANAVQDIVEHFLGPDAKSTFNGNGDPKRYLPADHPPFLSTNDVAGSWLPIAEAYGQSLTAASLQAQQGAIMPPPFGQDALTWCNQFAADEFCIFTEGYPDRATRGWPQLMYGTREMILSTATLHTISGDDVAALLAQSASFETKPESDINRVLVWGKPFGQEIPLTPAAIQGEARFNPSNPRSAEQTWQRTYVAETPLTTSPEAAQALAQVMMMEAAGEKFIFPKYPILGDADCMTGDIFTAANVGLLGGENINFRAERIEHEFTQDGENRSWTTNISLRTMSDREAAQWQSLQS